MFLNGMSDAAVARRWAVSPSTVAAQRFKRGVYRDMRPEPPRALEAVAVPDAPPLPERPALRAAQRPPDGDWRAWLFLGGRGAGKTLAGAAWLAGQACEVGRLALVGPTYSDVREVMIEGPSGLRGLGAAFGPVGGPPRYEPSRRRLVWPNGSVGFVFTAEDPDGLRGPQFHAAWADEVCAWARPAETLAQLRMGLRLGEEPKLMLSTTPRPITALRDLMAEPGLVSTRGSALDNAANLAPGFVEGLRALYGGTRLERQEIDGEVLEALEGAVFRAAEMERARALWGEGAPERFDRVTVAVDPPAGLHGAACGLVTAARSGGRAWVLADDTVAGCSPLSWAQRVRAAASGSRARAGRRGGRGQPGRGDGARRAHHRRRAGAGAAGARQRGQGRPRRARGAALRAGAGGPRPGAARAGGPAAAAERGGGAARGGQPRPRGRPGVGAHRADARPPRRAAGARDVRFRRPVWSRARRQGRGSVRLRARRARARRWRPARR